MLYLKSIPPVPLTRQMVIDNDSEDDEDYADIFASKSKQQLAAAAAPPSAGGSADEGLARLIDVFPSRSVEELKVWAWPLSCPVLSCPASNGAAFSFRSSRSYDHTPETLGAAAECPGVLRVGGDCVRAAPCRRPGLLPLLVEGQIVLQIRYVHKSMRAALQSLK